jgi:asparagine synthase (glutamine-hydrolysing)
MTAAMAPRGPDGEGFWESSADERGWGVLLGHRRLAILDLSPAGAQPMIDPVAGNVIVFNGEIYNFQELRNRLLAAGERFESTGDTQVMLRMIARQGPDAVRELRGMFAFASWDPASRTLLVARDPLGIKPVYFARNPDADGSWSVAFASEVRALLASGLLVNPRLDPAAAASVAWNGFVTGPKTAVSGIEAVRPGELRVFNGGGRARRRERFWDIPPAAPREVVDEEQFSTVLADCVRLHLISDVPLAVFLSSGIDSSVVTNVAKRAARSPVHTFTLAFEDRELNEGDAARRIAEAIGTEHKEVLLREQDVLDDLVPALDSIDQPTFDGLNSYYMSRAIRRMGFKVALVGTGGDELFGGYRSFRELPVLQSWSHRVRFLPKGPLSGVARLVAAALQPSNGFPPQTRWAKLPHMVRQGTDLLGLYQIAYALFLPEFQEQLLAQQDPDLIDGLPATLHAELKEQTADRSPLSALAVLEQRLFLGERLLRDNDAASMAASIEQRLPLVDQGLFEAVDRLPDDRRFAPVGRKSILRRVGLRGLDPALFERPKAGFVLPYDTWIRKGLGKIVGETLRDCQAVRAAGLAPQPVLQLWNAFQAGGRGIYWTRVWALFVLVRWCQRYGVRC